MENLDIYNQGRIVPQEAKKTIAAGRLKGMTDINPMWRIKKLTEIFGPCGLGWYTEVEKQWLETGANNEMIAFCNIRLYVKYDTGWGNPIFGCGGSKFIAKESGGLFTSDECYKMAYTDAISVACKALGIGADVYWDRDDTKYDIKPKAGSQSIFTKLRNELKKAKLSESFVCEKYKIKALEDLNQKQIQALLVRCEEIKKDNIEM